MSGPPPKKPPRPWYRPHASTWVVMGLALAGMTFWNVAGYYEDPGPVAGDELWHLDGQSLTSIAISTEIQDSTCTPSPNLTAA